MLDRVQTEYEVPVVLDTFSALEVMGVAEGLVGNGSSAPSVPLVPIT